MLASCIQQSTPQLPDLEKPCSLIWHNTSPVLQEDTEILFALCLASSLIYFTQHWSSLSREWEVPFSVQHAGYCRSYAYPSFSPFLGIALGKPDTQSRTTTSKSWQDT